MAEETEKKPEVKEAKLNREKQGIITGIIGLFFNLLMGTGKLIAGIISGSVSIMAQAADNFADSGSSLITIIAFPFSYRKADKEHPFGHGRFEYIASLILGIIIVIVGVEFAITSIGKIRNPALTEIGIAAVTILSVSLALKLFMFFLYKTRAKKLNSGLLDAAASDSIFDVFMTAAVLIAVIVEMTTTLKIDGIIGLIVSLIVVAGGIKLIFEIVGKLMGNGASEEIAEKINDIMKSYPIIIGYHDLYVHDYGPNKQFATIHAEFDCNITIVKAHKLIDFIEKRARKEIGIELVIHVDPIDVSSDEIIEIRKIIREVISSYHKCSLHELEINNDNKLISFEVSVTRKYEELFPHIKENLITAIKNSGAYIRLGDYEIEIGCDIVY